MDAKEDRINMSHTEKAKKYFEQKYHCSQAVLAAFAEDLGLTEEQALKLGGCFGAGMCKGEVCGACVGALMVLGMKYGHYHEGALEEKANAYKISEDFMNRFIEKNGTVVCRELLGYDLSKPQDAEKIKELYLFKSICPKMIQCATEIVEEMLQE